MIMVLLTSGSSSLVAWSIYLSLLCLSAQLYLYLIHLLYFRFVVVVDVVEGTKAIAHREGTSSTHCHIAIGMGIDMD